MTCQPAATSGSANASPWSKPPPVPWIISTGGPVPATAYSMAPEAALEDLAPAAGPRPGLRDLGRERPPGGAAGQRRTGADEPENEKPPPSHRASIARRPRRHNRSSTPMASIILAAAGTAIGGSIGGAFLGVSAATIGGAVGSLAGAAIDSWLVASMAPTQRIAGQRLDTLQITSSTEGAVIPRAATLDGSGERFSEVRARTGQEGAHPSASDQPSV